MNQKTYTTGLRKITQHNLHWRRTKIVATLGPASNTRETIKELMESGLNVVRLNMSHGTHAEHKETFDLVRSTAKSMERNIAILFDLCGPKLRTGTFRQGKILLKEEQEITLTTRDVEGDESLIVSQYRQLHEEVKKSDRILLDDGKIELAVNGVSDQDISCTVIYGGVLSNNKGINLPDTHLGVTALSEKDMHDVDLAIEMGADFLALSFVRNAKDVIQLQDYLTEKGADIPIIAKIEKPEAVANIKSIMDKAYGIMIARGDLGIELPAEQVPLIQRDLIKMARDNHCPVIVATQMLESMIHSSRPTRAEVGDVAHAALSSADAVMLSGETAAGDYPVEAVQSMDRILREMENYQWQIMQFAKSHSSDKNDKPLPQRQAIARAATTLAHDLKLQGIIIPTNTGSTARIIAANRPTTPCIGVCYSPVIARKLALHWGVVSVSIEKNENQNWREMSNRIASGFNLLKTGNHVLLVSGFNEDPELNEPVMKLLTLEQNEEYLRLALL